MEKFNPNTQGILRGLSSADGYSLNNTLRKIIDIEETECILGIQVYFHNRLKENKKEEHLQIRVLLGQLNDEYKNYEDIINNISETNIVRCVDRIITFTEYFNLFDSFSLTLSNEGCMNGLEYDCIDK
ncbi:MAG: hypothetical protein RPU13_15720 [Candidatus Sedimenticola sp. (ex Thyasira tokunagai)]